VIYPLGVVQSEAERKAAGNGASGARSASPVPVVLSTADYSTPPRPQDLPLLRRLLAKLRAEQPHEVVEDECA
jgi:hypothetical protein